MVSTSYYTFSENIVATTTSNASDLTYSANALSVADYVITGKPISKASVTSDSLATQVATDLNASTTTTDILADINAVLPYDNRFSDLVFTLGVYGTSGSWVNKLSTAITNKSIIYIVGDTLLFKFTITHTSPQISKTVSVSYLIG
jgi:hypothetical protein